MWKSIWLCLDEFRRILLMFIWQERNQFLITYRWNLSDASSIYNSFAVCNSCHHICTTCIYYSTLHSRHYNQLTLGEEMVKSYNNCRILYKKTMRALKFRNSIWGNTRIHKFHKWDHSKEKPFSWNWVIHGLIQFYTQWQYLEYYLRHYNCTDFWI